MAGVKISEMPVASALTGTEVFEIVQGGQNKKLLVSAVGGSSGGAVDSVNGQTGAVILSTDDVNQGVVNKYYPEADSTKLSGVEDNAQVNTVDSVNSKTGSVVLIAGDVNAISTTEKGQPSGVATLDVSGIVEASQLPNLATARKVTVVDEAARLALSVYSDLTIAYQSDDASAWALNADADPSVVGNWSPLGSASATGVESVNTLTGNVVLDTDDVSEGTLNKYYPSADSTKLAGIEVSAQVNTVDSVNGYTGVVQLSASDVGAIGDAEKGASEGVATLDTEGKVVKSQLPYSVSLNGPKETYPGTVLTFTITDFSSYSDYSVSIDSGTVGRNEDIVSVTLPVGVSGTATLSIVRDTVEFTFPINVKEPSVVPPTVTSPSAGQTNVLLEPSLAANSFKTEPLGTDTHQATNWQVASDAGFTNIVAQSLNDTLNLTAWKVTPQLGTGQTYYVRVQYIGASYGASGYSSTVSFTTVDQNTAPTILEPTNGETMVGENPVITASAFSSAVEETHESTDWEVRLTSDNSVVWQSLNDTDNLVSITVPTGNLEVSTQYTVRVRYVGSVLGASQWASVGFTTDDSFGLKAGEPLGGGYYAGANIVVGGTSYALVVAPKAMGGESESPLLWEWVVDPDVPGATSTNDGRSNTAAIVAAGGSSSSVAAGFCNNLSINGYSDWHLPSKDELEICYRYLKPTTQANITSSGANPNSVPTNSNYTSSNPIQTSSTLFKAGGGEDFTSDSCWTSTQVSAGNAWRQFFDNGGQYSSVKSLSYYARAVRWVEI